MRYQMRQNRNRFAAALLVSACLFALGGCIKKKPGAGGPDSTAAPVGGASLIQVPHETALSTLPVGVGVRDFNQLVQAMGALTSVDYRDSGVQTAFNAVTNVLPTTNDIKSLSGPHLVSVARLASQYCDVVTGANDTRRSGLFPGINFAAAPSAITTAARDAVLANLVTAFTKEQPAPDDTLTELRSLYDDLKAALANTTASTRGLMVGVCTAVLGSSKAVLVY